MDVLLDKLRGDFPQYTFELGEVLCWSPRSKCITYEPHNTAGLLHELAHALLGHSVYASDVALLNKEVTAWEKAQELSQVYSQMISDEHIQNCLDTYRDWLHKRSSCPKCNLQGIQTSNVRYQCLNCKAAWHVTAARFCRAYRLVEGLPKNIQKSRETPAF